MVSEMNDDHVECEFCVHFGARQMATLYPRELVAVGAGAAEDATPSSPHTTVTVAQWNTLAASLCDPPAFPFADPHVLLWENRVPLLRLEAARLAKSDFIGMQEVDNAAFYGDVFAEHGLNGMYAKKVGGRDGCTLFYRAAGWTLLATEVLVLAEGMSQIALIGYFRRAPSELAPINADEPKTAGVLPEDELHKLKGLAEIVVAVTHFKAKPAFESDRVRQAERLTAHLRAARSALGVPVVVLGDFNTEPTGLVYPVMIKGGLRSAYAALTDAEPEFTTYKQRDTTPTCRTIDYIFASDDVAQPVQLLQLPSKDVILPMPNEHSACDHFALQAVLRLNSM